MICYFQQFGYYINFILLFIYLNYIFLANYIFVGIPAALVTVGAMETLIALLNSPAELVRSSAATAVGYMTYNRGAMRILLTACRRLDCGHLKLLTACRR